MLSIYEIISCMKRDDSTVQQFQTAHRMKLVEAFHIKEGSRVLEIGCGQGDTTAVLAAAVGEEGFVHGIDIAPQNYGAPITLGEAKDYLSKSKLGHRIQIDLNFDILTHSIKTQYDVVVLSHCLWYFANTEQLLQVLKVARRVGKRICIAEWDLNVSHKGQLAHQYAVNIQGLYEVFHKTDANIRTLFTLDDVNELLLQAGFKSNDHKIIFSKDLQDGRWEVNMADEVELSGTPMEHYLKTQKYLMNEAKQKYGCQPLNSFVICAQ